MYTQENSTDMNIRETHYEGLKYIELAYDTGE